MKITSSPPSRPRSEVDPLRRVDKPLIWLAFPPESGDAWKNIPSAVRASPPGRRGSSRRHPRHRRNARVLARRAGTIIFNCCYGGGAAPVAGDLSAPRSRTRPSLSPPTGTAPLCSACVPPTGVSATPATDTSGGAARSAARRHGAEVAQARRVRSICTTCGRRGASSSSSSWLARRSRHQDRTPRRRRSKCPATPAWDFHVPRFLCKHIRC